MVGLQQNRAALSTDNDFLLSTKTCPILLITAGACSAASDCTSSLGSVLEGGVRVPFLHHDLSCLGDLLPDGGEVGMTTALLRLSATLQRSRCWLGGSCPNDWFELSPGRYPVSWMKLYVGRCMGPSSTFGQRFGLPFRHQFHHVKPASEWSGSGPDSDRVPVDGFIAEQLVQSSHFRGPWVGGFRCHVGLLDSMQPTCIQVNLVYQDCVPECPNGSFNVYHGFAALA